MHNPISRICHAAVKNAAPDFSDRPDGSIFADEQADWTYVKDAARGIQMVHTAGTLPHRIYNIGSGRATSHQEIVAAVQRVVPEAICAALKPGRAANAPLHPAEELSRIKAAVGYVPEYTLETGIAAYIEWLRQNPQ
jgi:UDP-glucose 4-epimerase